jgi:mono/diheme cytochrome c family protein
MGIRFSSGLLLLASLFWCVNHADGQPPERPPLELVFKRADSNADGKLSRAEFLKFSEVMPRFKDNKDQAEQVFDRLDVKKKGFLSLEDFKKLAELAPKGNFPKKDNLPKKEVPKTKSPETAPSPSKEAAPTAEGLAFFEKKIRPVLVKHCYSCHAEDSDKIRGGLALDTREGLRAGGDSGPSIIVGNAKKSILIHAIEGSNNVAQMPPKEKLSADIVADFSKWIQMGAPDPREGKKSTKKAEAIEIQKGKEHWAFQQPKKAPVPAANATNPIDAFLLAKLQEKGLNPVGQADKVTLIRRVYFDLIGLPPTPEQVEQFLRDPSETAFSKVVDELLASPHFGERWGRHWLDVARYAESSGKEQNMLYPFAWRYRDYVIRAFNTDLPFNQFVMEQLAGDLLPPKDETDKAWKQIATGYLAIGAKSHNTINRQQFALDLADEQIDAFSQGMQGLTIACARCHDHKFDPIPTKDYYSLAGIFNSTDTLFGTAAGIQSRQAAPLAELPKNADVPGGSQLTAREVERLRERLADLKKQLNDQREADRKSGAQPARALFFLQQIAVTEKQLSYYDKDGNSKKMAMSTADKTFTRDIPVHIRGEVDKLGEVAPRGYLQVLDSVPVGKISKGSGRLELAKSVASDKNPLTARVYVNRVWQHLFGKGLVTSPDNFGTTGQAPSHPELLDFLAVEFMKQGWSTKKLIKELVSTQAYQRSSAYHEGNAGSDPDNVYLWRMSKRRLDAEAIRDAMFSISGQLDTKPAVASPIQKYEGNVAILQRFGGINDLNSTTHRSVYMPIVRDNIPEILELFDFAEPSLVTGQREDTSVPSQGLFMMNNPMVMKLAEKTAERLGKEYLSETERISGAFKLVFNRAPTPTEAKAAESFLKKFIATEQKGLRRKSDVEKGSWAALVQALFAAAEFRYVD